jgi:hypothetical protein
MLYCVLCEKEWSLYNSLCAKCRRIKHLINLYDDKVYKTLENCLVRNQEQIQYKENLQIKEEKTAIENVIETRSKKIKN